MNLNKEPATEQENRLQAVIFEMHETLDDLLDKSKFALTELTGIIDKSAVQDMDTDCSLFNMTMLSHIAFDYLTQAQSALEDIIARETRKKAQNEV